MIISPMFTLDALRTAYDAAKAAEEEARAADEEDGWHTRQCSTRYQRAWNTMMNALMELKIAERESEKP